MKRSSVISRVRYIERIYEDFIRQGPEVSVRNIEMFIISEVRYTENLLYLMLKNDDITHKNLLVLAWDI